MTRTLLKTGSLELTSELEQNLHFFCEHQFGRLMVRVTMKNRLKSSLHTTHQFSKKYPNYPTFYIYVQYQLNYSSAPLTILVHF